MGTTVRERLYEVALAKGLRQSTLLSYKRLLSYAGLLDEEVAVVGPESVSDALWRIDNPNTRRAATIAVRSVLGISVKIPRGIPRRYELPSEDTLRLALMTSPHEVRGLLMMYAGCRIGEACAVTAADVSGDRLSITKQVVQLHETSRPTICRLGPVKTSEAEVVIPHWLTGRVETLHGTAKPDGVRESLRRAGAKVGVKLTPHMLRHWFATTMLERGAPLPLVQRQMRHSDIAVTLRTYVQYKTDSTVHEMFG
jgi:integrase